MTADSLARPALVTRIGATVTPHHWQIQTGAGTSDQEVQDLSYYPSAITIDAGDSITWRFAVSYEPHTITLLRPGQTPPPPTPANLLPAGGSTYDGSTYVSSGQRVDTYNNPGYTVTFSKPGTYTVYCLFHQPAMEGTITVNPAGTPYPHDQAYYNSIGQTAEWADFHAGIASVNEFPFVAFGPTLAAGISPGLSGANPPAHSTVLKYLVEKGYDEANGHGAGFTGETGYETIHVGTTLTWINESSNERHTVTFGLYYSTTPPDPAFGGHVYDGVHPVNSGSILPGHSFSLKFTKVGCYRYLCLIHNKGSDSVMFSHINVVP